MQSSQQGLQSCFRSINHCCCPLNCWVETWHSSWYFFLSSPSKLLNCKFAFSVRRFSNSNKSCSTKALGWRPSVLSKREVGYKHTWLEYHTTVLQMTIEFQLFSDPYSRIKSLCIVKIITGFVHHLEPLNIVQSILLFTRIQWINVHEDIAMWIVNFLLYCAFPTNSKYKHFFTWHCRN